jgi:hypothetical protein
VTTFHSQFACQTKRTNDSSDWQHSPVVSPTMSSKTTRLQSIWTGLLTYRIRRGNISMNTNRSKNLTCISPRGFDGASCRKSVKPSGVTPTAETPSSLSKACCQSTIIKSDASTVVASKNNSGTAVTTSCQATLTSSSTNSPAATTVTGRIQPRISKCRSRVR